MWKAKEHFRKVAMLVYIIQKATSARAEHYVNLSHISSGPLRKER
jgi:hypothetical protein